MYQEPRITWLFYEPTDLYFNALMGNNLAGLTNDTFISGNLEGTFLRSFQGIRPSHYHFSTYYE